MANKVAQPKAETGQVWRLGDGSEAVLGERDERGMFYVSASMTANVDECAKWYGWTCIGISTPAGRVMVGERRRGPVSGAPFTVTMVGGIGVFMREEAGGSVSNWYADVIASWPLVKAAESAIREPQGWDTVTFGGVSFPVVRIEAKPLETRAAPVASLGKTSGSYSFEIPLSTLGDIIGPPGPATDPREQGPGIAARVPPRASVRPDVVACAEWDERWGMP